MGSPRDSTSGSGRTPTHHTRVRVPTVVPSVSTTPSCVASFTEVPIRTSTPRCRRTRSAVRESRSSISGMTRGATSSSIQRGRMPVRIGCLRTCASVYIAPCAATSVPV